MSRTSRRGVLIGALVALTVPALNWLLATLVANGLAPYDPVHALFNDLGVIEWISLLVLGPVGIVIAARSAGVKGAAGWLAVMIVALPIFAITWFISVATLGGALGNPF